MLKKKYVGKRFAQRVKVVCAYIHTSGEIIKLLSISSCETRYIKGESGRIVAELLRIRVRGPTSMLAIRLHSLCSCEAQR